MKTGVVLEVNNKSAIVMKSDGTFVKIPLQKSWQTGDIVKIKVKNTNIKTFSSIGACIILIMFTFGYSFLKPFSYLEISINPKVEITLNRYSRVIKIDALNKDGLILLKNLNIWGKSVDRGMKILYDKMNEDGLLINEKTLDILVIGGTKNISNNIETILSNTTSHHLNSIGAHCYIKIHQSSIENHNNHHKNEHHHRQ